MDNEEIVVNHDDPLKILGHMTVELQLEHRLVVGIMTPGQRRVRRLLVEVGNLSTAIFVAERPGRVADAGMLHD